MGQPAEDISLNCCIASRWIRNIFAVEQGQHIRPTSLVGEDLGFKKTKAEGPVGTARKKIPARLLGFLACNVEASMKKIAANVLIDRRRIPGGTRLASRENRG
jgi:hypothetical protein